MRAGYRGTPTWKQPARRRLVRRILLGGAVLGLVALAIPVAAVPAARLLGRLPIFGVHTVEVSGLLYLSYEEVRAMLPVREGDNILLLRPADVEEALRQNARIENAEVTRRLGGISVRILERRPFALVSAGSLVEVDEHGTVLEPLERGLLADRPVITGLRLGSVKEGSRISNPALGDLLRLVSLLESPQVDLIADISDIVSESRSQAVLHTAREQIPIVVDPEQASLAAMRALAATLRDLRARGRTAELVDARYRGQVVVRCAPGEKPAVAGPTRDKI
ncbi:MAG TPA: FtsQ-type POTRA domain-containing protein [Candidatus Eisenbacteria bacterium]|nr:FtsQ-type POTRA domain-containing protein [Candidatus Eisenbacteria bacterium]